MTNVMILTDRFIEASGVDAADMRLRARYLREANLLPNTPKGGRYGRLKPAQIETVHATILLIASLVGGPQIRVADSVRDLWNLPLVYSLKQISFGNKMMHFMEMACNSHSRIILPTVLKHLNIAQTHPFASILYHDRGTEYFTPPDIDPVSRYRAPVSTLALAGPEIFLELGEIVIQGRATSKMMGISIPVEESRQALGLIPGHMTMTSTVIDENAEAPGRASAPTL